MTRQILHICVSENRPSDEVAVKLLILSFARHEPTAIIHLFVSGLSAAFFSWVADFPNVDLEPDTFDQGTGWNIKPTLLIALLERGIPSVVWVDADIIITSPVGHYFKDLPGSVLCTAPEPFFRQGLGVAARARDWGLEAVRDLPDGINSSVLRVTHDHLPLLRKWQSMLADPAYQAVQQLPFLARPPGMAGDQDVLTALLSSDLFVGMEIRSLILGKDIAQCFFDDGFGPIDRLGSIGRLPPFVHAQGPKPWRDDRHRLVYLELSPYRYAAAYFRRQLTPGESEWLFKRSRAANILHCLGFGDASLAGLIPSIFKRARRSYRSVVKKKVRGA